MTQPLAPGTISLRLYPHDLGAVDQIAVIRRQARLGAEAGFDGVMVSEHHADFPGYLPNPVQLAGMLLEDMPTGWAAACPLLLPMKPYALVAEDLAWLAAAFPGRVGAGFAAGAIPVDFELAEVPFDEIVPRFKVALPLVVAALRGQDPTPLAADRAIARLGEDPLPMVVAAQSGAAVRRAARLGLGVLFDSVQPASVSRRLADAYDEAGGEAAKILIRRIWIGAPPTEQVAAQMAHYRRYANDHAAANWGANNGLVQGDSVDEVAALLAAELREGGCSAVNVRLHLNGLAPDAVEDQIHRCGDGFVEALRGALSW